MATPRPRPTTTPDLTPPSEVREMFIENPRSDFAGMFATHPPIAKRIEALAKFAGGRVEPVAQKNAGAVDGPRPQGPWG